MSGQAPDGDGHGPFPPWAQDCAEQAQNSGRKGFLRKRAAKLCVELAFKQTAPVFKQRHKLNLKNSIYPFPSLENWKMHSGKAGVTPTFKKVYRYFSFLFFHAGIFYFFNHPKAVKHLKSEAAVIR